MTKKIILLLEASYMTFTMKRKIIILLYEFIINFECKYSDFMILF